MVIDMNFDNVTDFWYNRGGCNLGGSYLPGGLPTAGLEGTPGKGGRILKQSNNIYDIANTAGYINPKYSALMPEWMINKRNIYSLIRKTDFRVMGDAFKVWFDDPADVTEVVGGVDEDDDIYATNDIMNLKQINGLSGDGITPKIIQAHWVEGLIHQLKQTGFQNPPKIDATRLRGQYTRLFLKEINKMLLAPVTDFGSLPKNLISLDNLISGKEEADARTLTTEVDYYNLDRNTAATNADAHLDISTTPRSFDLDTFDDLLAELSDYDPSDPFGLTTPKILNRWERTMEAKQQFMGKNKVVIKRDGVQTRVGETGGFQIATYAGGGVQDFPIFTDSDVDTPNSSLGNVYVIDNDDAELRMAMPESYFETPKNAYPLISTNGKFQSRYLLALVAETVISTPKRHLKYSTLE
jgi:hypothetical protein